MHRPSESLRSWAPHGQACDAFARERGTLDPIRPKTGSPGGLTEDVAGRLKALVAEEPGVTRRTLRDRLDVSVDERTVGRCSGGWGWGWG